MNNIINRGRGRPVGTGLDDGPTLNKMADIMVANPAMRPTTAMRRAIDKPGPSVVRRLQVKWKAGSAEYLAAARARRSEEHTSELQSLMRSSYAVFCLQKKQPPNIQTTHR